MAGDSAYKLKPSGMRAFMDHRNMHRNYYHQVRTFTVQTKTTEFANRLNLPSQAISLIGERDCALRLHVGLYKHHFDVDYRFRRILDRKRKRYSGLARLDGGWKEVYEYMELNQGDLVEFRGCVCDPHNFYLAKVMHDGLVEVKEEEFYAD